MKANELRIGNLVLNSKGEICKVTVINTDTYPHPVEFCAWCVEPKRQMYGTGDPEPIPLTSEVLEKCGFECTYEEFEEPDTPSVVEYWKIVKGFRFEVDYYASNGEQRYVCNKAAIKVEHSVVLKEVEHLHQLQNLYFALTGEELTIKL